MAHQTLETPATGLTPHAAPPPRWRRRKGPVRPSARWDRWGYLFIAPWIAGFLIFTAGPMVASIIISFTDYDMKSMRPVGLGNYADLIWHATPAGGHGDA